VATALFWRLFCLLLGLILAIQRNRSKICRLHYSDDRAASLQGRACVHRALSRDPKPICMLKMSTTFLQGNTDSTEDTAIGKVAMGEFDGFCGKYVEQEGKCGREALRLQRRKLRTGSSLRSSHGH